MIKKIILSLIALAIATAISLAVITARNIDKKEIERVNAELVALKQQKQQLEAKVTELDAKQQQLNTTIDEKNTEITINKQQIAKLEKQRDSQQFAVRRLTTENALEQSFATTFPQVINAANFGIIKLPIKKKSKILLPYYVIPAWFTETFIIEHNNMLAYKAEIKEFKRNEALYGDVITLKSEVLKLESEKTAAYKEGYDEAFTKYEDVNEQYIKLLKKPPVIEIKAPALWPTLGAAVLGLTTGLIL